MKRIVKNKLSMLLSILCCLFVFCAVVPVYETVAATDTSAFNGMVDEEVLQDIVLDCEFEQDVDEVVPEEIPIETMPEPEVVVPDIIELEVKLYNDNEEDFNVVDGKAYLEDVRFYLKQYAPEGMFIGAAAAMAYTEGGAGKQGLYRSTNNCFGIRANSSWEGYVYARSDGKVYKDRETAKKYGGSDFFRAYPSIEESVKDYVSLISSEYYCGALKTKNHKEYLRYILNKGYGEYFLLDMWMGVMDIYDLYDFDK